MKVWPDAVFVVENRAGNGRSPANDRTLWRTA
jgi:hypothetical protein